MYASVSVLTILLLAATSFCAANGYYDTDNGRYIVTLLAKGLMKIQPVEHNPVNKRGKYKMDVIPTYGCVMLRNLVYLSIIILYYIC